MDVADITDEEAIAMWDCLIDEMRTSWGQSGNPSALSFDSWRSFSSSPYPSATHGSRYVMNYANDTGSGGYGAYEDVGTMPEGSILAKPSFTVDSSGRAAAGPLFLMEKMQSGFFAEANDWKYTMIMPNGSISGTSKGKGSANVEFCVACHMAAPDTDHLFFLPDEYRK
ncbi:cytochrome P460 family protein [Thalassospira sp. MBR-102]|jgi:hypothetical protein|uniref:cytochrome P460 family protein n=1 Tax=Thalassospira sp. MBR-102 TaxID=3156466 RepID=UPI003395BD09